MNKERRNRISECIEKLEDIKCELEAIRDEECEAYENLPEGIQESERGEQMEEFISQMEDAHSSIEDANDYITEVYEA